VRVVAVQLGASLIHSSTMSKHFRRWKIDQPQLLPPSVQDFVPREHLSRFIVELVRESLDLGGIIGSYTSALGQPPFDPRLMVALLLNRRRRSLPRRHSATSLIPKAAFSKPRMASSKAITRRQPSMAKPGSSLPTL
jgi:hypothetical protein